MRAFWEFPTVSMGLSPIMAIYQARFNRYLENRGLKPPSDQKIWAFLGDGEMDEPESLGAITVAGRESLDNLIFVVNCNLQRLDGPVRGNGKIVQELEGIFTGAGWNVIKVLWGSSFDPLFAADKDGLLAKRMEEVPDGQFQKYVVSSGDYIRKDFFGKDPRLLDLVKNYSDEQLKDLRRGGHDPIKVYAAYKAAVEHKGSPTVILAQTIKGYGLGEAGEGRNITHQQKKLNEQELLAFRTRFAIPISDGEVQEAPFYKPGEESEEMQYLRERQAAARRLPAAPARAGQDAQDSARVAVRGVLPGHRRADGGHDDGLRSSAGQAPERPGPRQAHCPHRAGRGPHLRHGIAVPAGGHLLRRWGSGTSRSIRTA